MGIRNMLFIACMVLAGGNSGYAQKVVEDSTLGVKPTLKIENLSPAGHCDNQELTFFAPWADHYVIAKRRTDTSWIKDTRPVNTWFSQTLKPGINGMIYKDLDEHGAYEFIVKAFKGTHYRESEPVTRPPCIRH